MHKQSACQHTQTGVNNSQSAANRQRIGLTLRIYQGYVDQRKPAKSAESAGYGA
jgi:hypothetical protein